MIPGVEILVTNEVYKYVGFNWGGFWIAFGIIAVIGIISACLGGFRSLPIELKVVVIIFLLLITSLLSSFAGSISGPKALDYIQYKVTISDEVSMNEFTEKYKILDQEGKIFTIREKK